MSPFARKLTSKRLAEAKRLMGIGYSPAHVAWILEVQPLTLAKAVIGYGGHRGLRDLAAQVRQMRSDRIAANIAAYPSKPMWPEERAAA